MKNTEGQYGTRTMSKAIFLKICITTQYENSVEIETLQMNELRITFAFYSC